MPKCKQCNRNKKPGQFGWRNKPKRIRHGVCRKCISRQRDKWLEKNKDRYLEQVIARKNRWRRELTERIIDYLSKHPCVDCGFNDPRALDFDHLDSKRKVIGVSEAPKRGWSWERTLKEIEKCVVRCSNCHRIRTAEKGNWLRSQVVRRRSAKPEP